MDWAPSPTSTGLDLIDQRLPDHQQQVAALHRLCVGAFILCRASADPDQMRAQLTIVRQLLEVLLQRG